jgi:hypothetical protein
MCTVVGKMSFLQSEMEAKEIMQYSYDHFMHKLLQFESNFEPNSPNFPPLFAP